MVTFERVCQAYFLGKSRQAEKLCGIKPAMNDTHTKQITGWLDRLGISLSAVCLAHCLAIPVLLTLLPMTQLGWLSEELFHDILLTVILPTSVIALGLGCHRHRQWQILLLGFVGLGLLTSLAVMPHDSLSLMTERAITVVAGCLLVIAHYMNFNRCQHLDCDH